jgi:signal transduction histidine kinase
MHIETDAEVLRLRAELRDLVALSAIPVAWVGMAPPAVAAGLADALASLLQLDFAFVRLRDPGGDAAVEATRGSAWTSFPEWLEGRQSDSAPFREKEVVLDVGDDTARRRGLAVPVGFNGEGGVVAAASGRSGFPTPTDQLLMSLAANHAAAVFHSARLIDERIRAEAELRGIRDALEVTVADRTAELQLANDELNALRHVATLVAQGIEPHDLFALVAEEIGQLLGLEATAVVRFDHEDPAIVLVGASASIVSAVPVGTRWDVGDPLASAEVYRTGRSARDDARDHSPSRPIVTVVRDIGVVSTVASPIIVEGRRWGAMTVSSTVGSLPPDTEERLEKFTELVATAIANAESSSELAASRRRIVAASDEARRRIERDLHDGTQQRLVSLGLAVRATEATISPDQAEVRAELSHIATELADAVEQLQEISRGIHPPILSEGGLGPALRTLARRSPVPVELDVTMTARLPEPIEVAAYYVASEAFANAAKHAQASRIQVSLAPRDGSLLLSIRDDGVGGADYARGSGLVGLTDRVEALGGWMHVQSRPLEGTLITASLPLVLEVGR